MPRRSKSESSARRHRTRRSAAAGSVGKFGQVVAQHQGMVVFPISSPVQQDDDVLVLDPVDEGGRFVGVVEFGTVPGGEGVEVQLPVMERLAQLGARGELLGRLVKCGIRLAHPTRPEAIDEHSVPRLRGRPGKVVTNVASNERRHGRHCTSDRPRHPNPLPQAAPDARVGEPPKKAPHHRAAPLPRGDISPVSP